LAKSSYRWSPFFPTPSYRQLALKLHNTIPEGNMMYIQPKFRKTSFGNSVLSTKLFDQLINPSRSTIFLQVRYKIKPHSFLVDLIFILPKKSKFPIWQLCAFCEKNTKSKKKKKKTSTLNNWVNKLGTK